MELRAHTYDVNCAIRLLNPQTLTPLSAVWVASVFGAPLRPSSPRCRSHRPLRSLFAIARGSMSHFLNIRSPKLPP